MGLAKTRRKRKDSEVELDSGLKANTLVGLSVLESDSCVAATATDQLTVVRTLHGSHVLPCHIDGSVNARGVQSLWLVDVKSDGERLRESGPI